MKNGLLGDQVWLIDCFLQGVGKSLSLILLLNEAITFHSILDEGFVATILLRLVSMKLWKIHHKVLCFCQDFEIYFSLLLSFVLLNYFVLQCGLKR